MAIVTANKAKAGVQARFLETGAVTVVAEYTSSATLAANDVIQMFKIPKGARITALKVGVDEAIEICVGDGVSLNRYMATATASTVVVGLETADSMAYEYTAEDTVDIEYIGGQTASTAVSFVVIATYICDDSTVK